MTWSDIPFRPTPRNLRWFAAGCLVFFSWLAYRFLSGGHQLLGLIFLVLALVTGPLGLAKPGAVRWFYVLWMVLVFPIGWVVSQVMLAVLFYLVLTPAAILFRLRGRDLLARKKPNTVTFWRPKHTPEDVRRYFKQY
jgi:hypothetical protein